MFYSVDVIGDICDEQTILTMGKKHLIDMEQYKT